MEDFMNNELTQLICAAKIKNTGSYCQQSNSSPAILQ